MSALDPEALAHKILAADQANKAEGGKPMQKRELTMTREKETKGTWRYSENPDGSTVFGYVYIRKESLGNPVPERIKVTVEPV